MSRVDLARCVVEARGYPVVCDGGKLYRASQKKRKHYHEEKTFLYSSQSPLTHVLPRGVCLLRFQIYVCITHVIGEGEAKIKPVERATINLGYPSPLDISMNSGLLEKTVGGPFKAASYVVGASPALPFF
jgi:hypothetical protein